MELGVVGLGYWGPNIVRNGIENRTITQVHVHDIEPERVSMIQERYRSVKICSNYEEMLNNDNIEAMAIVTPVSTHFKLAKAAIEAGKHLIIEKPFVTSVQEAEQLIDLSIKKNVIILVDHTFLYTSAVRKMKQIISRNDLGDIFYYDSVRVNLGMFQHDVNVIWDLAPHDFSIMDYLLAKMPSQLSAMGEAHIDKHGIENIAYVHLNFENGLIAHFHLNWLSPVKVRKVLIGGSKKMLEYDDLKAYDKLKVYDKGVEVKEKEDVYKTLIQYRTGDMYVPQVENVEALKVMMEHFVDCVESQKRPSTDATSGLRGVRLLEAAQKSIKSDGNPVKI